MAYIQFGKEVLTQWEFSFKREYLLAGSTGAYSSSSVAGCNTRKYHGLFVAPQTQIDDNNYVLLSALDEIVIRNSQKNHLATRQYPNNCNPEGYRFLTNYIQEQVPTWDYEAGEVAIRKELLMADGVSQLLIRYTILDTDGPVVLQFEPFMAFRSAHALTSANISANRSITVVPNGIQSRLYDQFDDLFLQFSRKCEFIQAPEWYYKVEYEEERQRGYDYQEDLYRPGYFELSLKKGEQLVVSVGLKAVDPKKLLTQFKGELKKLPAAHNLESSLQRAAKQFIRLSGKEAEVTAGFHWFGRWGRDTFIALPGLTLPNGDVETFQKVVNTMLGELQNGLFPNCGSGKQAVYTSVDASLWYIWALQQYAIYTDEQAKVWKEYSVSIISVLENYRKGTALNIHMMGNGLIHAGADNMAPTWMDAMVEGRPVTPRAGCAVEINALWYNAVCFAVEAARATGDTSFAAEWQPEAELCRQSFVKVFWNEEYGYLADCVKADKRDMSLRPNQILAVSLPYCMLNHQMQTAVMAAVKNKLLTPRGLRTLSPDDSRYIGYYRGDQRRRDSAYHQGTVWPWLLGHYAEACFKVRGDSAQYEVEQLYENFAPAILEYGVGTIAEIYDGNEPHAPKGAISQAWSVAELLRIHNMIKGYIKKHI